MIAAYDDLTPEALAPLGFHDPAHACRLLQEMAGHDVPDAAFEGFLATVTEALEDNADPDRAAANLGRWADAVTSRTSAYTLLASSPPVTRMLLTVFAASQFFADLLIHTPEYLEVLTNPTIRDRGRGAEALWADLSRRIGIARAPNAQRDALRRFKPPEILRIGVRDLLGYAPMAETARAISDFADVCVRMALQICIDERGLTDPPFAVIALGKLGGRELNYSSDIDLIFVHGDDLPAAEAVKLGEAVRDTLAKATGAGFVFRVDLRLRPEGRFGPVSRSLPACRAYYESWAEPWERQALMKTRGVAGNAAVQSAFEEMAEAFAYPPRVEDTFVESIRSNKRRLEAKIAGAGEAEVNVKEGVGGIRDIEFTVQLMQLVAGGAKPSLRGGNTLNALRALEDAGLLTDAEAETLRESYEFLRTVEHRLQIRDELPVRDIPIDPGELRRLGRRLGYPDGAAFLTDYRRHTARTNLLFRRLFYGELFSEELRSEEAAAHSAPVTEWAMAPDDPVAQDHLRAALTQHGFHEIEAVLETIGRSVSGSRYGGVAPDAQVSFAALLPALLDASGQTESPDAAWRGLDALADAVPSRAALFLALRDSPTLLTRLCRLAAGSPPLWQSLLTHLELLDLIADDESMDRPPRQSPASDLTGVAAGVRRSRLQTGARDLWGLADTAQALDETTQTAQTALAGAWALARQETGWEGRFAVIGLGKLGGGEMGYGSDLDVLYVTDAGELRAAARLAERMQRILRDGLAPFGVRLEMDARLRPEGRSGPLALDLEGYRRYYAESAATWERQALVKARPVGGDESLGLEFAALAHSVVYAAPLSEPETEEIRAMKRRWEGERAKGANDIKLGPGGLSDIEWTVQMLQLRYGTRQARLRTPGTLDALRRLRDEARLSQADWETLSVAYLHLTQLRNRRFLRTGISGDAPPALPEETTAFMAAARAVCLRVFYGE